MTKATTPSGSIDELVTFRQGIDVITIKDQLAGLLPKISGGRSARVVISGNAPDSEVYFDDSMIGLGPGTIIPVSSSIGSVRLYSNTENQFVELSSVLDPGIFKLEVSGTYTGKDSSTFRIQIANPNDEDVYAISSPIFNGTSGLNDLNIVFENVTEVNDSGIENILIQSSSYINTGVITTYKVEIASSSVDSIDTIRWYKNGKLITTPGLEEPIKTVQGNVLIDGSNRVVIKFDSDGYNRSKYTTVRKHTVGDSWTIIAGSQQLRWAKGKFNDINGVSMFPTFDYPYSVGLPTGILQKSYQYLSDGIYVKLPTQIGYPDGLNPNLDPPTWEFSVTSANPEAAITAMQESIGKIQTFPDHRIEQRDFGQPKLHNDFDLSIKQQRQISTVEVLRLEEIGEQNLNSRTAKGNTKLYNNSKKNKKNFSYLEANELDEKLGLDVVALPNPTAADRGWTLSSVSSDGSVGPYFTIQSLEGKYKTPRNNHFWFNFGNTATTDLAKYDDTDPLPEISDGIPIDVSGRDLSEIVFTGNDELLEKGVYEVHNVTAIKEILAPVAGEDYWSNDGGKTLVEATDVRSGITFPTSINSKGEKLYYLVSVANPQYIIAKNAGWDPDVDIEEPSPKMSIDINGNSLNPPLEQDDWMEYHGYVLAEIEEIEWMLREGYKPYQDILHDKWFIIYNDDYEAHYIHFHVTDNILGDPLSDVTAYIKLAARRSADPGNIYRKSSILPTVANPERGQIVVKIKRTDTAEIIGKKIIERINSKIPAEMLEYDHPFYMGVDTSEIFESFASENNPNVIYVRVKNYGKVQEPDIQSKLEEDAPDFRCIRKINGNLGYAQKVLDYTVSDAINADLLVKTVGKCVILFNATLYGVVAANKPHVVWFNLNNSSYPPAGNDGKTSDEVGDVEYFVDLWSYEINESYKDLVIEAFDNSRQLPVTISTSSADNTISYQFANAINTDNLFKIPFICLRPKNDNIVRIMQRDPGEVVTPGAIPDQTCHKVNCDVSVNNLRPGIATTPSALRDRDYISDSIKFAIDDSRFGSARFSAEKRVVKNFAKFQIKCVAEQKNGKLFDYTDQVWLDPDPDVNESLAQTRPGGISSLSNYETNLEELFDDIPQKTAGGEKVWTRVDSKLQVIASNAGFNSLNPNYDSKNHLLWASAVSDTRTITTAKEQGLGYDEMQAAGWFDTSDVDCNDITEDEWMGHEGYTPVPAFTHKIAKAAYFLLPHPEKNFYIWFDVGQISADPGDDGALDSDVGVDLDSTPNISYNGGAVRVAVDSYSNAGEIAKNLVNRINSDKYDIGKKFVQVDVDDEDNPVYQQLVAGNLSQYFSASIDENDSSVVNIICKKSGLINTQVFNKNKSPNFKLPVTDSGDTFAVELLHDGDTDYYVDIANTVPGFVLPPITDVSKPDADTNLSVSVNEIPYSPAQPGLTKVVSEFIAYEDMSNLDSGYRKTLDDGKEIAVGGPVSYIQDDMGSLIYPVIMSNASMKDPDQYDGVIEPLEIRSRASRNSPDSSFVAHDVRGDLQSDVAADSRRRSNPIMQFIDLGANKFEPYEDGIEHIESSPAVDGFVRRPVFNGSGLNDIKISGEYSATAGTGTKKYYIKCVTGFEVNSSINDKFKWRLDNNPWSEIIELTSSDDVDAITSVTFDNLGNFGTSTTLYVSEQKTVFVPGNVSGYDIKVYARGDIDESTESYTVQYFNETSQVWTDIPHSLAGQVSGQPFDINESNYPGADSWNSIVSFPKEPNWHYQFPIELSPLTPEELPIISTGNIRLRIISSADVNRLEDIKNSVKIVFEFQRNAGQLELSNGLTAVFDSRTGHTSGDEWVFEAVPKSFEDRVGTLPLPGYLTWQESKIKPFTETSYDEQASKRVTDIEKISTHASATMAFNYPGYSGNVGLTPGHTWENVYLSSLNGQAFTLTDSAGVSNRFEFDNDGELENDGQTIISLLRPEVTYIRFPDVDNFFQKRDAQGNLLWKSSIDIETDSAGFAAYSGAPVKASDATIPGTSGENYQNYDSGNFQSITEEQWASYYDLIPANASSNDVCETLKSVNEYAGKYFIITDAIENEKDHINNTISGGRYAVWFNIVDETGNETAKPSGSLFSPGIDDVKTARWSNDKGITIVSPTLDKTGWNPDSITKTMSTSSAGNNLWTIDNGQTIVEQNSAPSGYVAANLDEDAWHAYHGYEDYSKLIPQYIEVKVKYSDSVKILVDETVRAIKKFKNKNKLTAFDCEYIAPPEYIDYLDAKTAGAGVGEKWVTADYDDSLFVKLEDNWFYQYSYDPDSPPVKAALARGWSRGYYTIKISSRNLGYHNIVTRLDGDPKKHEPLYSSVPTDTEVRNFSVVNDEETDWGGYKTFKELLDHTSDTINSSSLDIDSEIVHSADTGPTTPLEYKIVDSSSLTNGIVLTSPIEKITVTLPAIVGSNLKGKYFDIFDASNIRYRILFYYLDVSISSYPTISSFTGNLVKVTFGENVIASLSKNEVASRCAQAINSLPMFISSVTDNTITILTGGPTATSASAGTMLGVAAGGVTFSITSIYEPPLVGSSTYHIFNNTNLIKNTLVRYPTKLELNSGLGIQQLYRYRDFLCGLRLTQKTAGSAGNTKIIFHHYDEEVKGNLIPTDFSGGKNEVIVQDALRKMNPGTDSMIPNGHKSSSSGTVYENMLLGTDSITHVGRKK